jgi:hypothetical protein
MLHLLVKLHVLLLTRTAPPEDRDRGQATTEYALVILGAAMIALLVVAWATAGGGAGKIGKLFDKVLDSVIGKVS